jgi:hypothetical protein
LACSCQKRLLSSSYLSFLLSVCPPACVSLPPSGMILVKFDVGVFYKNFSTKSKCGENQTKMSGTLHVDRSNFYNCWWHMVAAEILLTASCNPTMQNK